jgi:hypothetical protein
MNYPLSGLRARKDEVDGFTDFVKAAACIMTTRGAFEAADKAAAFRLPERVVQGLTKAVVPAGTTGGVGVSTFGPAISNAFMETSRNYGFADEVARFSMQFPDKVGRAYVYSNFAAGSVAEGKSKGMTAVNINAVDFDPVKVANMTALSSELIDALGDEGLRTLGNELRKGVAIAADAAFLAALSGNSAEAAGADTWAGFMDDFEELLRLVDAGSSSKLWLVLTPQLAKEVVANALANGINLPNWNRFTLGGVEVRASDAQTADRATLIDSTGLATSLSELELRSSEEASVVLDSAPSMTSDTPTAAQQVSAFQDNARILICERSLSVQAIRTNAFAHLTNVALGETAGSPAGI